MASNKTIAAVEATYKIIYTGEMTPPNPNSWILMLINTARLRTVSFLDSSVNTASSKITAANHGLITGISGKFTTTGTLPTPLTEGTDYWIINLNSNEFQIASSLADAKSGTAISLTNQGSGTHTFVQNTVTTNSNIEQFVSIEVPNQYGYERKQVLFPVNQTFQSGPNKVSVTVDVDFPASGGNIAFDGVVLIANGSTTYGDTSGYVWTVSDQDPRIIPDGSSFLVKVNAQTLTVAPSTTGLA